MLSFVLSFLFHLAINGAAEPRSDGLFPGGFRGEEPMNHPHPRRFSEGPKSEFSRICSPWHPFGRWWLPDFLKNVSIEGMNGFCDIVRNENLTKAETEQQLDQWAHHQGEEVYVSLHFIHTAPPSFCANLEFTRAQCIVLLLCFLHMRVLVRLCGSSISTIIEITIVDFCKYNTRISHSKSDDDLRLWRHS
uniref:SXP/RAL-2 family protein Ani s 5-like cation-binding domain-containing protein n=1 Tax=Parascaris equorum TaxID=6256 RepID=A0A914REC2_PAREQ